MELADQSPDSVRNQAIASIPKWDGYNMTWIEYCNTIRICLADEKNNLRKNSTRYTFFELAEKFL